VKAVDKLSTRDGVFCPESKNPTYPHFIHNPPTSREVGLNLINPLKTKLIIEFIDSSTSSSTTIKKPRINIWLPPFLR
jgi:hypothetical protein